MATKETKSMLGSCQPHGFHRGDACAEGAFLAHLWLIFCSCRPQKGTTRFSTRFSTSCSTGAGMRASEADSTGHSSPTCRSVR